jgi:putative ABC transport system permease protein
MFILKFAIKNLLRRTKRTFLLFSLITTGMAFLFIANSIFESADNGLKSSFVKSLTGDAALCANSENTLSLFGNEIPIVGEYETIPAISDFKSISSSFNTLPDIKAWTPVVSAAAYMEIGSFRMATPVFGIDPKSYFKVCSDIVIEKGNTDDILKGGIFLNSMLVANIEKKLGRSLAFGEIIKLSMYSNGSFKIRNAVFSGIYSYVSYTQPLDRIALADPLIVRSLADYTLGYALPESGVSEENNLDDDFSMESLFDDSEDIITELTEGVTLKFVEDIFSKTEERDNLVMTDNSSWSFVLFGARENKAQNLQNLLLKEAKKNNWDVKIMNWRTAAGFSAQAAFALQTAFNVGMVFIVVGAALVITNALVISVIERRAEIGTMRAVGAGKEFIRMLFVIESMSLTMAAAIAGIIAGIIISVVIKNYGIVLKNDILITLFGGNIIKPLVTARSIVFHLMGACIVGALSWIYPVYIAVKIQPVTIMGKG